MLCYFCKAQFGDAGDELGICPNRECLAQADDLEQWTHYIIAKETDALRDKRIHFVGSTDEESPA